MIIPLVVFIPVYLVSAYMFKWRGPEKERLGFMGAIGLAFVPALFFSLILGGATWALLYQINQDPVEIKYAIYPGPDGQYTSQSGDTTTWYYRDGTALKTAWKDTSYVNINYLPGETRGRAEAVCDSSETVPHWLLLPWEKDEGHIFQRECTYEDFNLYIPINQ